MPRRFSWEPEPEPGHDHELDAPPPPPPHSTFPPPTLPSHNPRTPTLPPSTMSPSPPPYIPYSRSSSVTPGMDNLGAGAAGGGIAGIAYDAAGRGRESAFPEDPLPLPLQTRESWLSSTAPLPSPERSPPRPIRPSHHRQQSSYSSTVPLTAAVAPVDPETDPVSGAARNSYLDPDSRRSYLDTDAPRSFRTSRSDPFDDGPFNRYSSSLDPRLSQSGLAIDPAEIEDEEAEELRPGKRKSLLTAGGARDRIGSAGIISSIGNLVGRQSGSRDASGTYGPVPGPASGAAAGTGEAVPLEKSEWLSRETHRNTRLKWVVGTIFVIVVIAAIVGGAVGGVLASRNHSSSSPSSHHASSSSHLDSASPEIKDLQDKNLHRVFPGMDYTPLNAQYPDCLSNPPDQGNVTKDVAILSQLTNRVRLYGTDCNQTEMVLEALDQLKLQKDVKIWLGVWLENNSTTNTRQLNQMYDIVEKHGADPFAGVIVGNEVLFRKDLTQTALGKILTDVRSKLKSKNIDLPISMSDLGEGWPAGLVPDVDIIMANVHPFFGGVPVNQAADWTWRFWQNNDVPLAAKAANKPKNIISEVGWPSDGGNNCVPGPCTSKKDGSVASVDNLNRFMDDFVCQSLSKKVEYFWFEAFDEPWKVQFNTPGKDWEDKWGLLDANRKLKKGVKIPDCGGKTVS